MSVKQSCQYFLLLSSLLGVISSDSRVVRHQTLLILSTENTLESSPPTPAQAISHDKHLPLLTSDKNYYLRIDGIAATYSGGEVYQGIGERIGLGYPLSTFYTIEWECQINDPEFWGPGLYFVAYSPPFYHNSLQFFRKGGIQLWEPIPLTLYGAIGLVYTFNAHVAIEIFVDSIIHAGNMVNGIVQIVPHLGAGIGIRLFFSK
jgi:hypothetical protein